jgi:hypothetical protein
MDVLVAQWPEDNPNKAPFWGDLSRVTRTMT